MLRGAEVAKAVLCCFLKCHNGRTCRVVAKKLYIANSSLDEKSVIRNAKRENN